MKIVALEAQRIDMARPLRIDVGEQMRLLKRVRPVVLAAVLWLAPMAASADSLVVGAPGDPGGFCAPFGCNFGDGTRFQQVYSAQGLLDAAPAPITTPILITQIDFFHAAGEPFGNLTTGDFEIHLSTTGMNVDALDTVFDNNVGGNDQVFSSFSLSNGLATESVFSMVADTPFLYDPLTGNLLLDIFANDPTGQFPFEFFEAFTGNAGGLFSIMQNFGSGESTGFGLVTGFHYTVVPEPSTFLLLGMGILAIELRSRRRSAGRRNGAHRRADPAHAD
jgi:hypothetical protein